MFRREKKIIASAQ